MSLKRIIRSLRFRLVLLMMLTTASVLILFGAAMGYKAFQLIETTLSGDAQMIASVMSRNLDAALAFNDKPTAIETLETLDGNPHVRFARIFDSNNRVFAVFDQELGAVAELTSMALPDVNSHHIVKLPIESVGTKVGLVELWTTDAPLQGAIAMLLAVGGLGLLLALGVALVVSGRVQHHISGPILRLSRAVKEIEERGDYSIRAPDKRTNLTELHILTDSFNRLLGKVEQRDKELAEERNALNTEGQERSDELQEVSHQLEMAKKSIDASVDQIIVTDIEGKLVSWNTPVEELSGKSQEELTRLVFTTLLASWSLESWEQFVQALSEGEVKRVEGMQHGPDESKVAVEIFGSSAASEELQYVYLIIRDMTQLNDTLNQLREAQKMESLGQLAAGIAHEINTPIQYIGDNLRFLNDSFDDIKKMDEGMQAVLTGINSASAELEGISTELGKIREEADLGFIFEEVPEAMEQSITGVGRVAKIVRAMKEFAHPGTEEKKPSDLNDAIESTITVSRNVWRYVADLEANLDPDLPPVPCFVGEITQVVLNLIVNGSHAISDVLGDEPEGKGKITVTTRREGDFAQIIVEDTGTGIPQELIDKVFDPFFTTKEVGKGTGQGLAITRKIIEEMHEGKIELDSVPGEGAKFTLSLPMEVQQEEEDGDEDELW